MGPTEVLVSPEAVPRMAAGDTGTSVRQPLPTDKVWQAGPSSGKLRGRTGARSGSAERAGNPSRQRQQRGTRGWAGRAEVALMLPNFGGFLKLSF